MDIIFNTLGSSEFDKMLNKYELQSFIKYYKENNKSPHINMYHGFHHVKLFLQSLDYIGKNYLTEYGIRLCMIAAIFHDFNHYVVSDGKDKNFDSKNIKEAQDAFLDMSYHDNSFKRSKNYFYDSSDIGIITNLISMTQYPYEDKYSYQNLFRNQKLKKMFLDSYTDKISKCIYLLIDIMRDCDKSMFLYNTYNSLVYLNLVEEKKITNINTIINGVIDFLNFLNFNTEIFQNIWEVNNKTIKMNFCKCMLDVHEYTNGILLPYRFLNVIDTDLENPFEKYFCSIPEDDFI